MGNNDKAKDLAKDVAERPMTVKEAYIPKYSVVAVIKDEYWNSDIKQYVIYIEALDKIIVSEMAIINFEVETYNWKVSQLLESKYFSRVTVIKGDE